ncbi:hypothetical protein QOZ89_33430 [Pseudofrankia sp. BMG5.37]|nr:hypothetical protein [Pseudofrankia sp. BMG5.37]MDT3444472.1 hypothetical protein [Pseudofrankia sp. BMG5.37]
MTPPVGKRLDEQKTPAVLVVRPGVTRHWRAGVGIGDLNQQPVVRHGQAQLNANTPARRPDRRHARGDGVRDELRAEQFSDVEGVVQPPPGEHPAHDVPGQRTRDWLGRELGHRGLA